MKLSQLIEAWDELHVKDTGEMGFCDLDNALTNAGVEIENDIPNAMCECVVEMSLEELEKYELKELK